jgi:2-amino-4-hydroxy-6-hydroxymethyldihydropteridine diphosphokinase
MLTNVYLGLGSNKGRRLGNLKKAIREISFLEKFSLIAKSEIYETEPWGFINQNKFLNCIICGIYRGKPQDLYNDLNFVEKLTGRTSAKKWGPREIDIDILFCGDKIINTGYLKVPHPYIEKRNFVLKPLSDMNPCLIHPVFKKNVGFLYSNSADKLKVKIFKK